MGHCIWATGKGETGVDTPEMTIEDIQENLLKQMTAGSQNEETIVIHFSDDDVDQYLKMLDRYENRPSKKLILVR